MRRPMLMAGLTLAGMVILLYGRVLGHGFVTFDDPSYITENPFVRDGMAWESVKQAFLASHAGNWHPLTWLSHMLDVELFGLDPAGHHAVNVLLHAVNAILLFVALRAMTGRFWASFFIACVFAVHPLRVESVAWASERKDVLSGFFWMTTLLAYAHYAKCPEPRRYALVFISLALGLMAKPMLVTLPCVLLLLDLWPLRRWRPAGASELPSPLPSRSARQLLVEKIPLLALSAAASIVTILAQRAEGAMAAVGEFPLDVRLGNALPACLAYLWKTVWPVGLACFYPHPALVASRTFSPWSAAVIVSGIVLAGVTLLFARWIKNRPYLLVGWLWYLGTLFPVIGIVQVGEQAMADRYAYIPLIGIYLLVTWFAVGASGTLPFGRSFLAGTAGLIVLGCALITWAQVGYWRDSATLYRRAIDVTEDNAFARTALAHVLLERGNIEEARAHLEQAFVARPHYLNAHLEMGRMFVDTGDLEAAAGHYEVATRIAPDDPTAFGNLGLIAQQRNDLPDAARWYELALQVDRDYAQAHLGLARMLERQERFTEAENHYRRALEIWPGRADLHNFLGICLGRQGRSEESAEQFERSLRLQPEAADPHNNLGYLLAARGDLAGAVSHYREALRIDPQLVTARVNLGAALEASGQAKEAVEHYRLALEHPSPSLDAANRLAWILSTSSDPALRNGEEALLWAERCASATGHEHPEILATLAAAYAESGRFDEAVRWQEAALERAPASIGPEYAERLESYKAGRPFRDEP